MGNKKIKPLYKLGDSIGSGCGCIIGGDDITTVRDKNGKVFCAPCQTIEYTCADNPQIVEQRRICPATKGYYRKSEKTEKEIEQDADKAVKNLFNRDCDILTPGYFSDKLSDFYDTHQKKPDSNMLALKFRQGNDYKNKEAPALYFEKARSYENWRDSGRDLELAITLGKAGFAQHAQLIELNLFNGRIDTARKQLDKLESSGLKPDTIFGMTYLKSEVLIAEGRYNEAEKLLRPYKNKKIPEVSLALGDLYLKSKQFNKAWQALGQVILDPRSTKGLFLKIGQALQLKKQWQRAENLYRTQLTRLETNPAALDKDIVLKAHDRLGVVLWMQGKINEAKIEFEKALQIDPNFPDALYDLASMEYEEGKAKKDVNQLERALARYQKVLSLQGPVDDASYGVAQCLEKIGKIKNDQEKIKQARLQFETLATKAQPYPKALLKLVEIRYWEKDYAGMQKAALLANKLLPNDFTAAYQLGEAYRFNEEYNKAYHEYRRAKELAFHEGVLKKYLIPLRFNMADSALWVGDIKDTRKLIFPMDEKIGPDSMVEWDRLTLIYKVLGGIYDRDAYQDFYKESLSIALKNGISQKDIEDLYEKWIKQVKRK